MKTLHAIAKSAAIECYQNPSDPVKLEQIIRLAIIEDRARFIEALKFYCTHDDNGQKAQSTLISTIGENR